MIPMLDIRIQNGKIEKTYKILINIDRESVKHNIYYKIKM